MSPGIVTVLPLAVSDSVNTYGSAATLLSTVLSVSTARQVLLSLFVAYTVMPSTLQTYSAALAATGKVRLRAIAVLQKNGFIKAIESGCLFRM